MGEGRLPGCPRPRRVSGLHEKDVSHRQASGAGTPANYRCRLETVSGLVEQVMFSQCYYARAAPYLLIVAALASFLCACRQLSPKDTSPAALTDQQVVVLNALRDEINSVY